MTSHRKLGKSKIEISISPEGGLRFKRKPSAFNECIGNQLRGQPGPKLGKFDKEFQAKFTAAVRSCAGKKAPESAKESGPTSPAESHEGATETLPKAAVEEMPAAAPEKPPKA